MEVQRRRQRPVQVPDQENVCAIRGKNNIVMTKKLGPTVRGALGELNSNVQAQRDANIGKVSLTTAEKKEALQRGTTKSTYSHVQSKIDTGLSIKTSSVQTSAKPILRREESTASHAARATRSKVTSKENIKLKENGSQEKDSAQQKAPKPEEKGSRPNEKKVQKSKPILKEDIVSLESLRLAEPTLDADTSLPDDIEDIDAGDENSPFLMSEYIKDIYKYLTALEDKYPIEPNYLHKQPHITGKMRSTLIDWLVDVRYQFNMTLETFHLTVGTLDRYLQAKENVRMEELQLVGTTCMFIACKYEEIIPVDVSDFVTVSDEAFTKMDMLRCERNIMSKLGFSLAKPIPLSFLRRFMKAAHGTAKNHHLAKYFVDLTLVEYTMVHYKPSELAAAAICLSMYILSSKALKDTWTPTLRYYTGYSLAHIEPIMRRMAKLVIGADSGRFKAVYKGYCDPSVAKVALLPQLKSGSMLRMARTPTPSPSR